jgi:DnaJ-class molecular chaperone
MTREIAETAARRGGGPRSGASVRAVGETPLELVQRVTCDECEGTGTWEVACRHGANCPCPGDGVVTCEQCHGEGEIPSDEEA